MFFYKLYLKFDKSIDDLVSEITISFNGELYVQNEYIAIVTDSFAIDISGQDELLDFKNEQYGESYNVILGLDIHLDSDFNQDIIKLLNLLLKLKITEFLLEYNGETPIVYRRYNKMFVDRTFGLIGRDNLQFDFELTDLIEGQTPSNL